MTDTILEFLEAYKRLDELCRQLLASDRGVSEYIDEMGRETQGCRIVSCWENDYKQLKKMRWKRNRLVHETNSFEEELIKIEDIEWLRTFYRRIMECSDPFSLLRQSKTADRKAVSHEKTSKECRKTIMKENSFGNKYNGKNSSYRWQLFAIAIAVTGIIIGISILNIIFSY